MEGITHRTLGVNGINLHIAEKGQGPVVLLLHGFPEIWYAWRHQIVGLAALGYHAVAPDLRGYGDSDAPSNVSSYTIMHLVGDVVALIDALGEEEVYVVGHDWGAIIAWFLCLFRGDRVKALVNLSVPFRLWDHDRKPIDHFRSHLGDDFYMCRFQEEGVVEAELACISNALVMKKFYSSQHGKPLIVPKDPGFGAVPDRDIPLPSWLAEEDLDYLAKKFDKSGYTGPLNYYRAADLSMELAAPWKGAQVKVPAMFIIGDRDLTYSLPGVKDYIHDALFKKDVPLLEEVLVVEGVSHYIHQERAQDITHHIHDFISKF